MANNKQEVEVIPVVEEVLVIDDCMAVQAPTVQDNDAGLYGIERGESQTSEIVKGNTGGIVGEYVEGHPGMGEEEVQAELDAEDGGTIGFAVRKMRQGFHVARKGWGFLSKGIFLEQSSGRINVPHVLMEDVSGRVFVWDINQSDLLAVDWYIVE